MLAHFLALRDFTTTFFFLKDFLTFAYFSAASAERSGLNLATRAMVFTFLPHSSALCTHDFSVTRKPLRNSPKDRLPSLFLSIFVTNSLILLTGGASSFRSLHTVAINVITSPGLKSPLPSASAALKASSQASWRSFSSARSFLAHATACGQVKDLAPLLMPVDAKTFLPRCVRLVTMMVSFLPSVLESTETALLCARPLYFSLLRPVRFPCSADIVGTFLFFLMKAELFFTHIQIRSC
mmetsp:Transcript_79727/g.140707  ORF Transcript_79727/g.140707 Transcript_79727/m.140707 type:complete len:239 (+) Transcript_79727:73-789(+)